jgi:hypothetical protein
MVRAIRKVTAITTMNISTRRFSALNNSFSKKWVNDMFQAIKGKYMS